LLHVVYEIPTDTALKKSIWLLDTVEAVELVFERGTNGWIQLFLAAETLETGGMEVSAAGEKKAIPNGLAADGALFEKRGLWIRGAAGLDVDESC